MILALLLVAAAVQSMPPSTEPDDILVIGERMRRLRIVMKKDRRTGVRHCIVKPSSGDAVLDAGICDAYLACIARFDTRRALEACMKPPLTTLVERWVERRAALRTQPR